MFIKALIPYNNIWAGMKPILQESRACHAAAYVKHDESDLPLVGEDGRVWPDSS